MFVISLVSTVVTATAVIWAFVWAAKKDGEYDRAMQRRRHPPEDASKRAGCAGDREHDAGDVLAWLEAGAAARLVRVERANLDRLAAERRRAAIDEPLRHRRRAAAAVADGLELVDEFGDAQQRRHRAERLPAEVLRESCRRRHACRARRGPRSPRRSRRRRTAPRRCRRRRTRCRAGGISVLDAAVDRAHLRARMRYDMRRRRSGCRAAASRRARADRRSRRGEGGGSALRSCRRTSARRPPRASPHVSAEYGSRGHVNGAADVPSSLGALAASMLAWWLRRVPGVMRGEVLFDAVAEAYDRERPSYPDELIDAACSIAALRAGSRVLGGRERHGEADRSARRAWARGGCGSIPVRT